MAKKNTQFVCSNCGDVFAQWAGQCSSCLAWNSLVEEVTSKKDKAANNGKSSSRILSVDEIDLEKTPRTLTQISELDRVLGGGIVSGSVVLLGGAPGIGKSTLLLQMMAALQLSGCLYISGEESAQQIALRADRLGLSQDRIRLLTSTSLEQTHAAIRKEKPQLVIIDSIQTLASEALTAAPGSVSQVRQCAAELVQYAKQSDTTLFIVGHVTKEGTLAGPRVLEHMVDTVLYFEGDDSERYRLLRATKNRFGAVNELGVFVMMEKGLQGVKNPSAIFLSHHQQPASGSVITVTREGTRPLLVEVQALVDENPGSHMRRIAVGLEQNRLSMLLAVAHRHGNVALHNYDVFVNVVGGVRVQETAADLAIILATLSSFRDQVLPSELIIFGEVGLAGEIRPVPSGQERLKEAEKHGFKHAIVPKANLPKKLDSKMEVHGINRLSEAIDCLSGITM